MMCDQLLSPALRASHLDGIYNESYVFTQDNLEINLDKWAPGTPLWITGSSGDGKSTLAKKMAEEHAAVVISTDMLLIRLAKTREKFLFLLEREKNTQSLGDVIGCKISKEFIDLYPEMPYGLGHSTAPDVEDIYSKYFNLFFQFIMRKALKDHRLRNRRVIVEGCDVTYMDLSVLKSQPLIILGCSRLRAFIQRCKRKQSGGQMTYLRVILKMIKKYREYGKELDDRKDILWKNMTRETLHERTRYESCGVERSRVGDTVSQEYMSLSSAGSPYFEAYWGRDARLDEMVDVSNKIVDYINDTKKSSSANVSFTKLNRDLEKCIKKKFGFKRVEIVWPDGAATDANAMTLVSALVLSKKKSFAITKGGGKIGAGFYDTEHSHTVLITVWLSIVRDIGITGEELVALLLHEIGHNFDTSVYVWLGYVASIFRKTLDFFIEKIPRNLVLKALNFVNKNIEAPQSIIPQGSGDTVKAQVAGGVAGAIIYTLPPTRWAMMNITKLYEKLMDGVPFLKIVRAILFNIKDSLCYATVISQIARHGIELPVNILMSPIRAVVDVPSRKKEIFADSFATAYGFGPQLATSLRKIELIGTAVYVKTFGKADLNDPITKFCTDLSQADRFLMSLFVNGDHGTTGARLAKILSKLKREADKIACSSETKKEILSQIDQVEESLNAYVNADVDTVKLGFTAWVRGAVMGMCNNDTDIMANLFPDHEI